MTSLTRRGFGATFSLAIAAALFLPSGRARAEDATTVNIDNFTCSKRLADSNAQ